MYKEPSFNLGGTPLRAVNYETCFKYLGIKYSPTGKLRANIDQFNQMLERIAKAPLKPQQKLDLLRSNIIPKVLHSLVLGRVTKGLLQSFDSSVRSFVRRSCGLTEDVPIAFFTTGVKQGGLGIPSLSTNVPLSLLRRLQKMENSSDPAVMALCTDVTITKLKASCFSILGVTSMEEVLDPKIKERFATELYSKIDGKQLFEFKANPDGQLWVRGRTSIVSGKNYRSLVQLRIGRLPTKENCNRGRDGDKLCRHCNRLQESLSHVVQGCHFSHFERMRRHNAVQDAIKGEATKNGFEVLSEPQFRVLTADGLRTLKPDLVAILPEEVIVADVTIVTEQQRFNHLPETTSLAGAWEYKRSYYSQPDLTRQLMEKFGKGSVWYGAIVIGMRGIWCKKNDETLKKLKIPISLRDLLVVRSMEGSVRIHKRFMATSS